MTERSRMIRSRDDLSMQAGRYRPTMAERGAALRRRLVRELQARGSIRSPAVRRAFLSVPRELFVPEVVERSGLEAVYRDEAIPTKFASDGAPISSSSQPAIMAEMLERLALAPSMRVLEIGAGTGYNAALLSHLVGPAGRVDAIDIDRDTAQRARRALRAGGYSVHVVVGDGRDGRPARAPYDRIIVTASSDTVPHAWFDQLADGGIVEVPLRLREAAGAHVIASLQKTGTGLRSVSVVCGGFMPLRGTGDPVLPPSMRSLSATDLTGDAPESLRQLSGAAVARLSSAAKRRLLSVSLEPPRRHPLRIRADAEALVLYLSTTLPARQAVTVLPDWGVGLISRDGRGLTYVAARQLFSTGKRTISSLAAHGTAAVERQLADAIRAWQRAGRPTPDQLAVTVTYKGVEPQLRWRWLH
jgi:protein-L-isoaspartate(D-aspartate) O-methyltransferase